MEQKLWGQDTKLASNGDELAYNHFKASHYLNGPEHSKVVVSHRHHGSRTYNMLVVMFSNFLLFFVLDNFFLLRQTPRIILLLSGQSHPN